MIARLLISQNLEDRSGEINKILNQTGLKNPHPDLLYFQSDSKLGIQEAKKIKEHFSLKPYSAKGRAVVLEDAESLTDQAQNALLKTIEELPEEAIFILGISSESKLLPTILSRCRIIQVPSLKSQVLSAKFSEDMEKLLTFSIQERFEYIENLKDRKEFLQTLILYFHENLPKFSSGKYMEFLKSLLDAQEWAEANVNIRGILEYLMLKMPD